MVTGLRRSFGFQVTATVSLPGAGARPPVVHQRGDVLITEFMKDPAFVSDSKGEWIELYNASDKVVNIEGWVIRDFGTNEHLIQNGGARIELAPGVNELDEVLDDAMGQAVEGLSRATLRRHAGPVRLPFATEE